MWRALIDIGPKYWGQGCVGWFCEEAIDDQSLDAAFE